MSRRLKPFKGSQESGFNIEDVAMVEKSVTVLYPPPFNRDASHVVFPTRIETSHTSFFGGGGEEEEERRAESSGLLFSPIPSKRSRLSESSLLTDRTRSLMESMQKKYSNLPGPSDVSLR